MPVVAGKGTFPVESEGLFREIVERGLDLVVVLDAEGIIRFASPSHEAVVGYAPAELVGKDPFRFMHPDDAGRVADLLRAAFAGDTEAAVVEFRFRHRAGGWRVLEAAGRSIILDPGIRSVVVSSRDVTARHRAVAETTLLLRVAHEAAGTVEGGSWLPRALDAAVHGLPCSSVAVWLLDADRDVWRAAAHVGLAPGAGAFLDSLEFPRGEPFDYQVERGTTIVVDDVRDQRWLAPELCKAFDIGSYVAASLRSGSEHLGLIVFSRVPGSEPFDAQQVQVAEGVARQIATALTARDVYRRQREEAQVAGALALLGSELMAALDGPDLLAVLCRVTAEILGSSESYTLLMDHEANEWTPIAGHGSAEVLENLPFIRLPAAMMQPVVDALESSRTQPDRDGAATDGVLRSVLDAQTGVARPGKLTSSGDLVMALRRRDQLIGVQVVRFAESAPALERWRLRAAPGLAKMASLALEHGRVVAELERALRLRTDFLATMSHELRTPLNVILGYSEMLQDDLASDGPLAMAAAAGAGAPAQHRDDGPPLEDVKSLVGGIDRSARGLLELIENTLDLGRLETRRHELELKSVDPSALLGEIGREVEGSWAKADVRFALRVSGALPVMQSDGRSMRIIVKNLISNAVKFTDRGKVTLTARARRARLELEVTDTGIGIAPADCQKIFDAYYQAEPVRGRSGSGVGLGLYIVRQLAERLGGDVSVVSTPGEGTRFRVRLPISSAPTV